MWYTKVHGGFLDPSELICPKPNSPSSPTPDWLFYSYPKLEDSRSQDPGSSYLIIPIAMFPCSTATNFVSLNTLEFFFLLSSTIALFHFSVLFLSWLFEALLAVPQVLPLPHQTSFCLVTTYNKSDCTTIKGKAFHALPNTWGGLYQFPLHGIYSDGMLSVPRPVLHSMNLPLTLLFLPPCVFFPFLSTWLTGTQFLKLRPCFL